MVTGDEQGEMPGGGMGEGQGYALSGKIMLSAIVILFFVVILMVTLHLYARWYLTRARRRHVVRRNGRNRRTHLVFYVDPTNQNPAAVTVTRGLDSSVLRSLPVFTYSSKTHPDSSLECAVCLSEFEENESGRVLPKCNHSFHLQCIDMWFHSHSTCPLCRSPVEPGPTRPENPDEVVLDIAEPGSSEPGSSSGLCVTCRDEGTSSLGGRRKPTEIDVPRRNIEDFVDESTRCDSPASQSFKSPMSRMLSFTRILSRDRRAASSLSSPSSANLASCGSVTELDIERGRDETQLTQG